MKTHWKKLRNPDYLGAYSFDDGTDKILTIKAIAPETVTTADGSEQCTVARWAENEASHPERDESKTHAETFWNAVHRRMGRPSSDAVCDQSQGIWRNDRGGAGQTVPAKAHQHLRGLQGRSQTGARHDGDQGRGVHDQNVRHETVRRLCD